MVFCVIIRVMWLIIFEKGDVVVSLMNVICNIYWLI